MRTYVLFLLVMSMMSSCHDQAGPGAEVSDSQKLESETANDDSKEMLLLGTFHFNNPGADVAKTKGFDILSEGSQQELDLLTERIKSFEPTKIFVEWEWDDQVSLDSLYALYKAGDYFSDTTLSGFYRKNEIFQLAFRAASKLGHESVYGIDYLDTSFPFDSMMNDMAQAEQEELQADLSLLIETFTSGFDQLIVDGKGLCDLYAYLNTEEIRSLDRGFYTALSARAGDKGQFTGAYLASEWYRRNLYMWSNMLKSIEHDDERVMVLLGASHISMFDSFCANEDVWTATSVAEVLCPK